MKHDVQPSAPVTAYGEGLTSAVEGKPATFVVDSKGQRGELIVQVDGKLTVTCNDFSTHTNTQ